MKKGAEYIVGVEAIMHTPFKDNYELDINGAQALARHIVSGGIVKGTGLILVAGAVGEFHSLTTEERMQVTEAVLDVAKDKTPVVVNVSHTDPRIVKKLARHAEKHGAYALQVSPPFYMPLSDAELVKFYREVSDEVSIGIMCYADYWASQAYFDDIWDQLCEIPNVVAVKWAHPNVQVYIDTLMRYRDELAFMDNLLAGLLGPMCGARGIISQIGVYAPAKELEFWHAIVDRDWNAAQQYFETVLYPLRRWIFRLMEAGIHGEGNPLKEAASLLGLPAGPARPPHDIPAPPELKAELKEIFQRVGIL